MNRYQEIILAIFVLAVTTVIGLGNFRCLSVGVVGELMEIAIINVIKSDTENAWENVVNAKFSGQPQIKHHGWIKLCVAIQFARAQALNYFK